MDLNVLLSHTVRWHKEAQYEPIVQLLELTIESSKGSAKEVEQTFTTKELAIQQTKTSLYTYFGDALYRLKQFRRALRAYEQALTFNDTGSRRASKRSKTTTNNFGTSITSNEQELKHQIHLCHMELHEIKEARIVLEKIPRAERSVKILASLADIYCQEKNIEKARETLRDILAQDPLRLDIIIKLCRLGGCSLDSVLSLFTDEILRVHPWYLEWIQAQCLLHSPHSKQAIQLLGPLVKTFERRAPILTALAEAHYHDGNFREAIRIFQAAYNNDPLSLQSVGSYAACLHKESSKKTLEDLAVVMSNKCSNEGEHSHEPWLVLAHYFASNDKKEPKALLFVQKAYKLNRYSVEALILMACLCLEKKDSSKAVPYIMTAHKQAPYRFEVLRILCDALLASNRKPAALKFAKEATEFLGETARAYYLWADIMLKSQDQRRKNSVRNSLEKAIKLDPTYLPAVLAYTDLLIEEKKFTKAVGVLNAALPHHSLNSELHKYLYTCYTELKDSDKALYHQNLASDYSTPAEHRSGGAGHEQSNQRCTQDPVVSQDDVEAILGLEANELVHGDSDVDETNLDS